MPKTTRRGFLKGLLGAAVVAVASKVGVDVAEKVVKETPEAPKVGKGFLKFQKEVLKTREGLLSATTLTPNLTATTIACGQIDLNGNNPVMGDNQLRVLLDKTTPRLQQELEEAVYGDYVTLNDTVAARPWNQTISSVHKSPTCGNEFKHKQKGKWYRVKSYNRQLRRNF